MSSPVRGCYSASTLSSRTRYLWLCVSGHLRCVWFTPLHLFTHSMISDLRLMCVQDFCHGQVMWPPLSTMRVRLAPAGKSCKQVCQEEQLICEPSFFQHLNKDKDLFRYQRCSSPSRQQRVSQPLYISLESDYLLLRRALNRPTFASDLDYFCKQLEYGSHYVIFTCEFMHIFIV